MKSSLHIVNSSVEHYYRDATVFSNNSPSAPPCHDDAQKLWPTINGQMFTENKDDKLCWENSIAAVTQQNKEINEIILLLVR